MNGTLPNVSGYAFRRQTVSHDEYFWLDMSVDLSDYQIEDVAVVIDGNTYYGLGIISYSNGTLSVKVGALPGMGSPTGYTSEEQLVGLSITVYGDYTQDIHLDKTWNEISNADCAVLKIEDGNIVYSYYIDGSGTFGQAYVLSFYSNTQGERAYIAQAADEYPVPAE